MVSASINVDVSAIDKFTKNLEASIKKQSKNILLKSAPLIRERILSNPILFVEPVRNIIMEMQGTYYSGNSFNDLADFSDISAVDIEVSKNLKETLSVFPQGEGSIGWTATIVSEEFVGLGSSSLEGKPSKRPAPNTMPCYWFFLP